MEGAGDAERWQRLRSLFDAVCELPQPQWESRLRTLSDDPALVDETLALLRMQTNSLDRALQPLQEMMSSLSEDELQVGGRLGAWQLVERLASGGMGTVFIAERADELFRQRVAIKLLRGSVASATAAHRLATERQILAELQHPNIARLHDGGTTPAGQPYLVMEYVEGLPLDQHCTRHRLSLQERVRLFLRVGAAVQAAHLRLIVHCDLKPSNVIVRDNGEPVLLDFGIARLLDAGEGENADGFCTPAYASPEQLQGARVGVSSDVFSLGVLLTETLAGAHCERTRGDGAAPLPSALAGAGCAWKHRLKGDLDAIAAKACAVGQQDRYTSVHELCADLDAWLRMRPVAAVRGGWPYVARRFLRRHRLAVSLAVSTLLALVVGLAGALWQARQAAEQRDMALVESAKSRAMLDFMTGLFEQADPAQARGQVVTARDLLAQGASRMRGRFQGQPEVRAELLGAMAAANRGLGHYREALPLADEAVALARQVSTTGLVLEQELNRVRILQQLGRYAEALAVLDRLQAPLESGATASLPLRAAIAHARGLALQATNRLDEAEQAYRRAHALRMSASGSGDRDTQETALRLVSLYVLRRQMDVAEPLARSTLAAVRASTGEHDPHRAEAIAALAMVLANIGPLQEAEALRREELVIQEAAFGATHPATIGTRNDLAGVLYAQGRFDAASDGFRQVLDARRLQYGAAHPSVATAANNFAAAELAAGRPAAARAPAAEALDIRLAAYGPGHHAVAASLHTLGAIELELGDSAALAHLGRAVESWESAMGQSSSHLVAPLRDLARAQILFGAPDPTCSIAGRARAMVGMDNPTQAAYTDVVAAACSLAAGRPGGEEALAGSIGVLRGLVADGDQRLQRVAVLAAAVHGDKPQ